MVTKLLRVFGDSNEKQIKRLRWVQDKVNVLESQYRVLSDDALRAKTGEFRALLADGETLDDLLPNAFAAVREAARRAIGLRHFDVQLIGGLVLHQGKVAEMKTGEGKTLVATLPLYLSALESGGAHLVTVNDYLARRDTVWMGPVYHALGLSVGCLQHEHALLFDPSVEEGQRGTFAKLRGASRREAYAADITYGTNNEFGFDFLRDNMVVDLEQRVQRELHYAIVDEVDNILIDEARTPLIISGPAQESTKLYQTFATVVPRLVRDTDYRIEEKERTAVLTDEGITKLEQMLNVGNLYDPANYVLTHYVENAMRAHAVYKRDKDYVVRDGEVVIVDEFTGRLMEGRRYGDGLHQALEAKEKLAVKQESVTYATITLQNYFRMYPKLAGMTGTAVTEAEEFYKVYKLDVFTIPTHMPVVREDMPDLIYKTEEAKYRAAADRIAELSEHRRPVLVGTVSIERSEHLSEMLRRRGVPHEVLNAKQHEREANIVAQAGRPGAVTVSTNMAGRGTDIILGGSPSIAESQEAWQQAHDEVVAMGGLFILGTERHESRRIDNQLRGRSGRQGDPGTTRFYSSLEDDIIRRFGGDRIKTVMNWVGLADDVPLESRLVSNVMNGTQAKVEAHNFDIRKHLVEYDDVVNTQRDVIYQERMKTLSGVDLKANIQQMITDEIVNLVGIHLQGDPNDWDVESMHAELTTIFPLPPGFNGSHVPSQGAEETRKELLDASRELYVQREETFGGEAMRGIERSIMLQTIDRLWVQHLTAMQNLRQGIGLYAYGQRDPLVMYKMEGHGQFNALLERIRHDTVHTVYHVVPASLAADDAAAGNGKASTVKRAALSRTAKLSTVMSQATASSPIPQAALGIPKVGRNDLCPCGSGKKYKRCHGTAA
jgi:preprotein translocase subunit SecA